MKFRIDPENVKTVKGFWIWALVIIVSVCAYVWPWGNVEYARHHDLVLEDIVDQIRIVSGLERARHWTDTLIWWHGPWVATPDVDFYRPLTSLVWWIEFQLLGGRQHAAFGFLLVHFASHILVCLTFCGFLRRLLDDRLALLCAGVWAFGLVGRLTLPTPFGAFMFWRDDPDMWVSIGVLLSLWALLSYWRTAKQRYLWGTVGALLMGIAFKEMAYVTPLLALGVLWHEWPRPAAVSARGRLASIALLFGIVALAFLYRFWVLQGYGFRFGSNGAWFHRFILYVVGGRPLVLALHNVLAPIGVALWVFVVWALVKRRFVAAGGIAVVSVVLCILHDTLFGIPFATFYQLITPFPLQANTLYHDMPVAAALMLLWVDLFRHRDRSQLFGYAWMFLAYLPLLTAPITEHALYLPSMGWGIWLSVGLARLGREFVTLWKAKFAPSLFPHKIAPVSGEV